MGKEEDPLRKYNPFKKGFAITLLFLSAVALSDEAPTLYGEITDNDTHVDRELAKSGLIVLGAAGGIGVSIYLLNEKSD